MIELNTEQYLKMLCMKGYLPKVRKDSTGFKMVFKQHVKQ